MTTILRQLYNNIVPHEKRLQFHKLRHPKQYSELRKNIYPSSKGDFSLKPFDEHRAIFVHITKTAGTSIALSLFDYLPYHYTAIEYRVIYGKKTFDNYFKFAFVRNPWGRLYSAYRYLKSGGWNEEDKAWGNTHIAIYNDFNQFVLDWLTPCNILKHIHFKPQHEFICDTKGKLLVDYLAYFETLEDDFNKISTELGTTAKLGSHNTNPGDNYKNIYSDEAKAVVERVYKKDIDYFGYNFEGIKSRRLISKTVKSRYQR